MNNRTLLVRLVHAVEHLAWPADRQRAYLVDLGVAPLLDELALEFDDALKPIQNSYAELDISDRAQSALNSIDLLLTELTELTQQTGDRNSVWISDALDNDRRWLDIRRLARTAHAELVVDKG